MKIIQVNIPEKDLNNGLKAVKMDKLGDIVLLTGKKRVWKNPALR